MITAVFLITALAVLGAMMTRMITLGSKESVSEWYSAQALYAAESGVDWAARYIEDNNSCAPLTTSDRVVVSGRSWFDIDISCAQVDALLLYTITSTGKAGGSAVSPVSQRQLQVVYSPAG
jgi:hypothetical protein